MRFDPIDRLEKINEAMVNLFEFGRGRRSRAAQREAERTGRGEMVTGRDGKQYPLGADPTRAQPGSALANQPAPLSREDAFLAAQPTRQRPAPAPAPRSAAPAAPAATTRPAAPAMPLAGTVAYGTQNQRPSYMPSPESLPSAPTFSGMARGTAAQGLFDGKPAAPAPATPAPTSGRQPIQPGSLPQIERQLQSAPSTTQTSGQGKGSLEQTAKGMFDFSSPQAFGASVQKNEPKPASGLAPVADVAGTVLGNVANMANSVAAARSTQSATQSPNFVEATPEERAASATAVAKQKNEVQQRQNAMGGPPSSSEQARRDANAALMDKLNPQSTASNPNAFRIPQGTPSASGFGASTSPKQPDMESRRAAAATNIIRPQTQQRNELVQQPDMESKRAAAATNIVSGQTAQRRNTGGSAGGASTPTMGD